MSLYARQADYFRRAYTTGEHGWPVEGPDPFLVRFVTRLPRRVPAGRALDVGCGEGRHTYFVAEHGYRAIGIDYQPLALRRARRLSAQHPRARGRVQFRRANVFSLHFPPASFDLVIDYGCLHHVRRRDTPRYVNQVLPLLKPGGHFLLSCFSTAFRHHAGERRRRNWLVHRGHYDRFFRRGDFAAIFGGDCRILAVSEARNGLHSFYHVAMRKLLAATAPRRRRE
jgi:SAM-dependent methyltransferase